MCRFQAVFTAKMEVRDLGGVTVGGSWAARPGQGA